MTVEIGGKLVLSGASEEVRSALKKALTLDNPYFFLMQRMGKYVGHMSPTVKYYAEEGDKLVIGRGNLGLVRRIGQALREGLVEVDRRSPGRVEMGDPGGAGRAIVLRPYQEGVVEEALKQENGVIRCGTGFGKTVIALKLWETLQVPTLILAPKLNVLEQFSADCERFLGFVPARLGKGSGSGDRITLSTMQSLFKGGDGIPEDLATKFGMVIVDECHMAVAEASSQVVSQFRPKYLYGMTATPRRSDGQGEAIRFLFGDILVDRDMKRLKPTIEELVHRGRLPMGEYARIIEAQVADESRNALIAGRVAKEAAEGRRILVLAKRTVHRDLLASLLVASGVSAEAVEAGALSKQRMDALRTRYPPGHCLVGTFALLSTGIDFPALDTVVFAGDLKSDILMEQSGGRILRLFDGKMPPKVIDVVDAGNPILYNQAKSRRKSYADLCWKT